ncbi:PTS sugar transporter subunit IIA [Thorsellia anophelis]|uniref:PTS system, mannose-specific IIA component n=1 Tax=Thorsellia anophelis DSM 18579 TaxID=1123402 RepID=A0A1I0CIJ0_9GAMM|nr:PTS sugar transporter subunit IIA [Thorsellia anophelis]SET19246.1 PTS system, mannose-specific IIA component [Thorsellia anophelis DSM 18579]
MKPHLILVSHGDLAEELVRVASMILDEMPQVTVLTMQEFQNTATLEKELKAALKTIGPGPVLVMADILGGTPSNATIQVMTQRDDLVLLSGVNLPMILEFALSSITDLRELSTHLRMVGAQGVRMVTIDPRDIDQVG